MQEAQEIRVRSLGQEDSLEEEMTTHSSIIPWRIPWTEEPGSPWGHRESDMTERLTQVSKSFAISHPLDCLFSDC